MSTEGRDALPFQSIDFVFHLGKNKDGIQIQLQYRFRVQLILAPSSRCWKIQSDILKTSLTHQADRCPASPTRFSSLVFVESTCTLDIFLVTFTGIEGKARASRGGVSEP